MTAFGLRCRVCEDVTLSEPVDACRRCDGPTDVAYDWDQVRATVTRASVAAGPGSLWRYRGLLPVPQGAAGSEFSFGAGWTPLRRAGRLSELLGIDLHLKLETANPTHSFKDRIATIAVAAALDHGVSTLCCSSTGNLGDALAAASAAAGLETIVLAPGYASTATVAQAAGASIFSINGTYDDCLRLELELAAFFPWGFLDGNLHAYASEGAKTISFEIAEQLDWRLPDAVVCPTASGTLFSKLAQGFAEVARSGLSADESPRMYAAQAGGASPIARAFADDRGISRVVADTIVHSLAVGDPAWGDMAIGAARATGGAVMAVPEERIDRHTALLAQDEGVDADRAAGVALGGLLQALRDGEIRQGERVVLVVTGTGLKAHGRAHPRAVTAVDPNVDDLLDLLGIHE